MPVPTSLAVRAPVVVGVPLKDPCCRVVGQLRVGAATSEGVLDSSLSEALVLSLLTLVFVAWGAASEICSAERIERIESQSDRIMLAQERKVFENIPSVLNISSNESANPLPPKGYMGDSNTTQHPFLPPRTMTPMCHNNSDVGRLA